MKKIPSESFVATRLYYLLNMENMDNKIQLIESVLASYGRALIEEYIEWKKGKLSEVPLTIGQLKAMYEEEREDIELFLAENI